MLARWPIRNKLLVGLTLLVVIVATLSGTAFYAVYAYRDMLKTLSDRVAELPLAATLGQRVSDLRVALRDLRAVPIEAPQMGSRFAREEFSLAIEKTREALHLYRSELTGTDKTGPQLSDGHLEMQTVTKIEQLLVEIEQANLYEPWDVQPHEFDHLSMRLDALQHLTIELPSYLHRNIANLRIEVRNQYRTLIALVWVTTLLTIALCVVFVFVFYRWVFRPLRILIKGSRKVALGHFEHQIVLKSNDEMGELAAAMNAMTARFRDIRDDLDRQVRERTKQAIRSEKLASVGFLAAGVSHEINNPLAAIAVCAEALESRLADSLADHPDQKIITHYLQMLQSEAFRCKGITEKLLDFSRMGDRQRQGTDLRELVQEMVDLLAHHGKYKDKHLELITGDPVIARVSPQEMKQVVLNLLCNGLDAIEAGGVVRVELSRDAEHARIHVTDNGCGMTDEVLEHLFEPFFTRRRGGQGTGLGLSITYRIVADHQGHVEASSPGPGRGSSFQVVLPLTDQPQEEESHRYQAA